MQRMKLTGALIGTLAVAMTVSVLHAESRGRPLSSKKEKAAKSSTSGGKSSPFGSKEQPTEDVPASTAQAMKLLEGEPDEKAVLQAVELSKKGVSEAKLPRTRVYALYVHSHCLFNAGQKDEAIKTIDQAIKDNAGAPEFKDKLEEARKQYQG